MRKKLCLLIFTIVLLFIFMTGVITLCDEKPVMLFFHTVTCEHCQNVRKEFLPDFLKKYGSYFTFTELEVTNPAYLDSLYALESRVGISEKDKDYPAVYFMGTMIEGEVPVRMRLEPLVKEYLANPDSMKMVEREVMSRIPEKIRPNVSEVKLSVSLAYFYKHGCKECSRAEEIITWLKGTYPFLSVDVYDISDEQAKLTATTLGLRAKMPENRLMSTPVMFIGDNYVLSEDISRSNLAELIEKYTGNGAKPVWRDFSTEELNRAKGNINDLFHQFTIFAIVLAGLGDGINPCAFATILFFISYLGMIGRKKNELLLVGLTFSFAIFVTYFLIGLGFFNVVNQVSHFEIVSKIIFGGTGLLCFVFGFLSISDYFKARAGNTSDMALQLPAFLKRRIHATIREKTRMKSFIAGALAAGFMVSILEFACTGQVYLPAITLMVRGEGGKSLALLYLFLYNICFIIPLLVVFGFVYFGMSSQGIARIMESKVSGVKLTLALVFFVMGSLLIWTVF